MSEPESPRTDFPPPFDQETAVARLGGEQELFAEMVDYFFDEWPAALAAIKLDLKEADAEALAHDAHRFKGTLVYLCAEPALIATVELEEAAEAADLRRAGAVFQRWRQAGTRLEAALMAWRAGQG